MKLKNKTMENKFYITTSIPYLNGKPHIGHALEFIQADVLARYRRLVADDVWFLTGTDEHGIKIARTTKEHGKNEKEFTDELAEDFRNILKRLNVSNSDFIRTSDKERHWPGVCKVWLTMAEKGDLYKKKYKGLYCSGCELFLKKNDLVDGKCPVHTNREADVVEEENWFFKLSKYKKEVRKKIEFGELKIVPSFRKNEILNLIDDADDVSFSRPVESLKWGIPVPNDPSQTIYVWADALTNYISALGYASDDTRFERYWPADVHLIGKDIFRFHALYWPAMLLSAGLVLPKAVYVHGFITVEGEKMSKSLGNVIDPSILIDKYGVDVVRYFLLREISSIEDGDFSYKKLEERYNGDLANGLGNLVQRVITLIDSNLNGELIYKPKLLEQDVKDKIDNLFKEYIKNLDNFLLHEALGRTWDLISYGDKYMDDKRPWAAIKHDEGEFLAIMNNAVFILYNIAWMLVPFMPETADKIFTVMGADRDAETLDNYKFRVQKIPSSHKVSEGKGGGLFPRLES